MKLSNLYVVQSVSSGCRRAAVAVRAAAFTLLLGAALPIAAQTAVTSSPYSGVPIAIPGAFEAENFDFGGEGVAYHDNVPGNAGGQYRLGEDVDIILSTDPAGGGYVVNNFETGEWLAYTINVAASAQYDIEIRASSGFPNSAFHIEIDGVNVTGTIVVPNTGGWSTFQWVGKKGVALTAGVHVLKVVSDMQYFDLNSIRVVTSGIVPTTILATVPAAVQALWSAGMEDGTMSAWYAGGGGGEFNGHPGSTAGSVGSDGSTSAASQEQAHSGAWSAKLTIPSNGACRLVRQLESQQYAELYYSAWYYFPQSYTLGGPGSFWMLMQWKSATATAHDPFFMLVAYSATPSTLNLGLAWFPLPVDGPLPGQSGYQLFPSNIQMPVGRWFQVETRYKSAGDFTGAIQMWIDGVEVYHMENVRTRYPDGNTIWSVTSYAQGLSPSPVVIYVDDVVISQTRPGQ